MGRDGVEYCLGLSNSYNTESGKPPFKGFFYIYNPTMGWKVAKYPISNSRLSAVLLTSNSAHKADI